MASGNAKVPAQLFAWHGMSCEVPADWELAAAEGNAQKGYCRLDDGKMARLEIRWQAGGVGAISGVVDQYVKRLQKEIAPSARIKRKTNLLTLPQAEVETFNVEDERRMVGLALRCPKCRRTCLVRVMAPAGEPAAVAKGVLRSFRDHGEEGRIPWSVLSFRFDAPAGYVLSNYALRAGRLDFTFRSARCVAQATRIGLAEVVLRSKSLSDWLKKEPAGDFAAEEVLEKEISVTHHGGIETEGRKKGKLQRLFQRGVKVRCRAWSCAESNAIYLARWTGPGELKSEFELLASSIVCHR